MNAAASRTTPVDPTAFEPRVVTAADLPLSCPMAGAELWSQHPRFLFVPHSDSFLGKLSLALGMLQALIAGWNGGPGR